MKGKRGQISTEYLIIVAFVMSVVIVTLGFAFVYSVQIKDTIRVRQIEHFAEKLISTSEAIFFAGEPSKMEIIGYVPEGVTDIQINGKEVVFTFFANSGENVRVFLSRVNLEGTVSPTSGVKKIELVAQESKVVISS